MRVLAPLEVEVKRQEPLPPLRVMVGKTERFFRFLQERVLDHNQAVSLEELQSLADR